MSKPSLQIWIEEAMCRPWLRLVPRWMKPNHVSFINHLCNWLLWITAWVAILDYDLCPCNTNHSTVRGTDNDNSVTVLSGSIGSWFCQQFCTQLPSSFLSSFLYTTCQSPESYSSSWSNILFGWSPFCQWSPSQRLRILLLFVCAGLDYACMVLDCLDGMHARATHQTSKLGELLDHWLDAVHVPLVTGSVTVALGLAPWAVVSVHLLNSGLYAAQMIHFHHHRKFKVTSGVEAQLGSCVFYYAAAALVVVPREHWFVQAALYGIPISNLIVSFSLIVPFLKEYTSFSMYWALFETILLSGLYSLLYWYGGLTAFQYQLVVPLVCWRVTGGYVLYTIVEKRFPGIDWWLWSFSAVIGIMHWLVDPIVLPVGFHLLGLTTVQDWIPYLLSVLIFVTNFLTMLSQYDDILAIDARNKAKHAHSH